MEFPFDVIVVGGGVLGLSVALACAASGQEPRIAIVDDGSGCASTAAGAMLGCFGEVTPETARHPAAARKLDLAVDAARIWTEWHDEVTYRAAAPHGCLRQGTHVVLDSHSGTIDDETFDAIVDALAHRREPYETVLPRDIPGYDPAPRARALRAIYIPGERYLDARSWLAALVRANRSTGCVTQVSGRVVSLAARSNGGGKVTTADGRSYSAPAVVVAAGVATHRLFAELPDIQRRLPPILAGSGAALEVRDASVALETVVRTPNRSFACGLHAVPQQSGALYIGATNLPGTRAMADTSAGDIHFLLSCAMLEVNRSIQRAAIGRLHAGLRPIPLDTLPMIGETTATGIWVASGTYRDGVHLSPLIARSIAAEILEGAAPLEPVFAPERELINTWTLSDAKEHAYRHYIALIHEREAINRVVWESEVIARWVREAIEGVYHDLAGLDGHSFVLPPDFAAELVEKRSDAASFIDLIRTNENAWARAPRPGVL